MDKILVVLVVDVIEVLWLSGGSVLPQSLFSPESLTWVVVFSDMAGLEVIGNADTLGDSVEAPKFVPVCVRSMFRFGLIDDPVLFGWLLRGVDALFAPVPIPPLLRPGLVPGLAPGVVPGENPTRPPPPLPMRNGEFATLVDVVVVEKFGVG